MPGPSDFTGLVVDSRVTRLGAVHRTDVPPLTCGLIPDADPFRVPAQNPARKQVVPRQQFYRRNQRSQAPVTPEPARTPAWCLPRLRNAILVFLIAILAMLAKVDGKPFASTRRTTTTRGSSGGTVNRAYCSRSEAAPTCALAGRPLMSWSNMYCEPSSRWESTGSSRTVTPTAGSRHPRCANSWSSPCRSGGREADQDISAVAGDPAHAGAASAREAERARIAAAISGRSLPSKSSAVPSEVRPASDPRPVATSEPQATASQAASS